MQRELQALKTWFLHEKRDFPWRRNATAYAVWVSEVMLQQTQASVVVPYFEKWMERFPTISSLAAATEEEVIKTWEGLGYYSRARHLHAGAKWVSAHHGGNLPDSEEALRQVKGLGPYTTAAILSFAFHQKAAALDGNVARVISRFKWIEEDICKSSVQKQLRELTLRLLPDHEPWIIMEAFIELGARICTKKPSCWKCPLKRSCRAFKKNRVEELPLRGNKIAYQTLYRSVAVIQWQNQLLLQLQPKGKLMAGLYEFPYFEWVDNSKSLQTEIFQTFSLQVSFKGNLNEVKQTFTKYRCHLFPTLWRSEQLKPVEGYLWIAQEDIKQLAFSSGHRRILNNFLDKS